MDLRVRVVEAIEAGLSTAAAARHYCVSKAAAGAWARLKRSTGSVAPRKQGKPRGSKLDAHEGVILKLIEAQKDITLVEMAACLQARHGIRVAPATLWYFLDTRGITFKKRQRMQANRTGLM
jgi:transposase